MPSGLMLCEGRDRVPRISSSEQARAIFGYPPPPTHVTEQQFDDFNAQLAALSQKPWDTITPEDLWYYLHDLAYVELQPDLFAYLFPACLNFWYSSLGRSQGSAQGDAEFHYALLRGRILEKMVTPVQRDLIFTFFHDGFLDRLDQERGFIASSIEAPAYGWMRRFNSLGLVTPLIERIWTSWWSMQSCGQAVSALMYVSGLMYARGENPIFQAPPNSKVGGVPPLWENDSYIFDAGWLPVNLDFLRRTLTVEYLQQKVKEAALRLTGEPEAERANALVHEYERLAWAVEIRIEYLLARLAEVDPCYFDW